MTNRNMTISDDRLTLIRDFLAQPGNADLPHKEVARQLNLHDSAIRRARFLLKQGQMMKLPIEQIIVDQSLQLRVDQGDRLQSEEYAEMIREGLFESTGNHPVVFYDGTTYLLADGFQRLRAYLLAGATELECTVKEGGYRDALLYAAGANAGHGVNRTSADKRHSVAVLAKDDEWSKWSDRKIAKSCRVSVSLVGSVRASICQNRQIDEPKTVEVERNGTTYEMKVGKRTTAKPDTPPPISPEFAAAADIEALTPITVQPPSLSLVQMDNGLVQMVGRGSRQPAPAELAPASDFAPRKQSDDQWLDTLTIRGKLADQSRAKFDADALAYRKITAHDAFRGFADVVTRHGSPPGGVQAGRYIKQIKRTLAIANPAHWLFCSDCDGTGFRETATCQKCYGCGYQTTTV